MSTILELYECVKTVDLLSKVPEIIEDTKQAALDLQAQQLTHGTRSDDQLIAPDYRDKVYAELKHNMNPVPPQGTPDLRLNGDFYKGLYLKVTGQKYEMDSADEKSEKLKKKYGELIFGLDDRNKEDYALNSFFPELKKYVESVTGLKLT